MRMVFILHENDKSYPRALAKELEASKALEKVFAKAVGELVEKAWTDKKISDSLKEAFTSHLQQEFGEVTMISGEVEEKGKELSE